MIKTIYFIGITAVLLSCSPYQKAYKSDDVAFKSSVANSLYEKEKYSKAINLYEQIAPSYVGKPSAERMFYMYGMSYYKTKQYYLAGYQFERFVNTYAKSEKREEVAFLAAECFYKLSPVYSLDQTDTEKAIDKLQSFINTYPSSEYLPKANEYIKELREKLEKKSFEVAKQYYTIHDYKAALKSLDNFISDFPGTPFKEDALYYRFNAAYYLAINSVEEKKKERLDYAKVTHNNLLKFNSETKYKDEINKMLSTIDKELKQYN